MPKYVKLVIKFPRMMKIIEDSSNIIKIHAHTWCWYQRTLPVLLKAVIVCVYIYKQKDVLSLRWEKKCRNQITCKKKCIQTDESITEK